MEHHSIDYKIVLADLEARRDALDKAIIAIRELIDSTDKLIKFGWVDVPLNKS